MSALVGGTCKYVTKTNVFKSGGPTSKTYNPPSPLEAGVNVASDGLTAIGAGSCP